MTFKWNDYRVKDRHRAKVMTLATDEFIRRFLLHVLPSGFHRIRHYGLFAGSNRADNIARARHLLNALAPQNNAVAAVSTTADDTPPPADRRPCCGGRMIVIERVERGATPRHQPIAPTVSSRIDTS